MTRAYDLAGRLISESLTTNGKTYVTQSAYDNANRRVTITYPNGQKVLRSYSDRNQLAGVSFGNAGAETAVITRGYTDAGRQSTTTFGNGLVESRSYQLDGLLDTMQTPGVTGFDYSYDANKRKTSETNTVVASHSQTFAYDDQDRLTAWTRTLGDSRHWATA